MTALGQSQWQNASGEFGHTTGCDHRPTVRSPYFRSTEHGNVLRVRPTNPPPRAPTHGEDEAMSSLITAAIDEAILMITPASASVWLVSGVFGIIEPLAETSSLSPVR
jgi:hypothetical protein